MHAVIVASYGTINNPGFSPSSALTKMNGPYSAYVIGDYTGITPPKAVPDSSGALGKGLCLFRCAESTQTNQPTRPLGSLAT